MTDYQKIYREQAAEYDRLVGAEDCDGNLRPALEAVCPLAGRTVLEVGAGTGRITELLVAAGARVIACDRAPAMIARARRRVQAPFLLADGRALPVASGWADLAVAGWVFGHLRYWQPSVWRAEVAAALAEMRRCLRPGGTLVLLETLGTGNEEPEPPTDELAEYFQWLETTQGFQRRAIRTDYQFSSVEEAATVTGWFLGDGFAERVRRERWTRVPECTGLWFRA